DLLPAQLLEVRPLHQRTELLEDLPRPPLLLLRRQRLQRSGLRVGVERRVRVLQLFQLLQVLEVEHGADQPAELPQRFALLVLHLLVPAQQLRQVVLPQRDVVLAVLVLCHRRLPPGANKPPLPEYAAGPAFLLLSTPRPG